MRPLADSARAKKRRVWRHSGVVDYHHPSVDKSLFLAGLRLPKVGDAGLRRRHWLGAQTGNALRQQATGGEGPDDQGTGRQVEHGRQYEAEGIAEAADHVGQSQPGAAARGHAGERRNNQTGEY